ncbi:DUF6386 family protein [Pantoea phytobeneficialis]|uniref:DUF6386 family protein n=1 Tax=Pantoea phytobeneficialis TaxID=2052056 RepID=A0AAP9KQC0_9GAMM|nr:DUF6386 family protein [Pantoea phytobeneficialis]MDO6410121.1 DUF6386 family protein [Pantoea phytobeneficialis]QGR07871.1 hypothetical protein CTZ24_16155 [Pantoea phytobeneficialis]
MTNKFSFSTDTATLSVFDVASLKHRVNDDPDWWSIPDDEVGEINKGNVLFLNLGSDGDYTVEICDDLKDGYGSLFLNIPVGKVFIGAGEDTSGGDLEPDGSDYMSGIFFELSPGFYEVKFKKERYDILLSFIKSNRSSNNINDLIRL